jgi:hypothetical protein
MIRQPSKALSTAPTVDTSKGQPNDPVRPEILESAARCDPAAGAELTSTWTLQGSAPTVAGDNLLSPPVLTFGEFINSPYAQQLFATGDTSRLLSELLKARQFHYFGIDAGKFRKHKTRSRKMLTEYVRRAYRGSIRGVAYWGRVANLLWLSYENFLQLRYWANRTQSCEIARLERKARRASKEKHRLAQRNSARLTDMTANSAGAGNPTPS